MATYNPTALKYNEKCLDLHIDNKVHPQYNKKKCIGLIICIDVNKFELAYFRSQIQWLA